MTAVASINEMPRTGYTVQDGTAEYKRTWEVRFDDGHGTKALAVSGVGINYGLFHPEDSTAVAYKHDADQQENVCFWIVSFYYRSGTLTAEQKDAWTQESPLLRKPRVSGGWETERVPCPTDINGDVIRNSAGDVPDPRIEADADHLVFHVRCNVNPLPNWVDTYRSRRGVINAAEFKIQLQNGQFLTVPAGRARLKNVKFSELEIENDIEHFPLSFDLSLREPPSSDATQDGWVFEFTDLGKRELWISPDPEIGIALDTQPIQDSTGQSVSDPVLLDGDGHALKSPVAWDSGTAYKTTDLTVTPAVRGDVVTNDGVNYYCIQDHTNEEPPDDDYWRRVPVVRYVNYLEKKDFRILPACSAP